MISTYSDSYSLNVKDGFSSFRKFIAVSMLACVVSSVGYFVFWLGAISDEVFFEYGRPFFEPLASFLNFGKTSIDIYLNTSFILFCLLFPACVLNFICNKTQEALIEKHELSNEKKRQKELIQAHKDYMARFDSIKTYSICLSLDYQSKKEMSIQSKATLNRAIFSKISSILKAIDSSCKIFANDVLIVTSNDFSNYDKIHDGILNSLAVIKKAIEPKYKCLLVPSFTTDAHSDDFNDNTVKNQHYKIQTFNFKNRALSTAKFSNKYKHLNKNKYTGVPIGEYAYFDKQKTDTYELNVIHKDLVKILS